MMRSDVIKLISETPAAHGIFDSKTETERTVFCTIRSVGFNEYYRALENALRPTVVFVLRDYAEYQGEKILVWENVRYRVVRTYITPQLTIELTAEEATIDKDAPATEGVATT